MFGGQKKNTQTIKEKVTIKKTTHSDTNPLSQNIQMGQNPNVINQPRVSDSSTSSNEYQPQSNVVRTGQGYGTTGYETTGVHTTSYTPEVGTGLGTGLGTGVGTGTYGTGTYGTTSTSNYPTNIVTNRTEGFTVPGEGLTKPQKSHTVESTETAHQKPGFIETVKQKIYPHHQQNI